MSFFLFVMLWLGLAFGADSDPTPALDMVKLAAEQAARDEADDQMVRAFNYADALNACAAAQEVRAAEAAASGQEQGAIDWFLESANRMKMDAWHAVQAALNGKFISLNFTFTGLDVWMEQARFGEDAVTFQPDHTSTASGAQMGFLMYSMSSFMYQDSSEGGGGGGAGGGGVDEATEPDSTEPDVDPDQDPEPAEPDDGEGWFTDADGCVVRPGPWASIESLSQNEFETLWNTQEEAQAYTWDTELIFVTTVWPAQGEMFSLVTMDSRTFVVDFGDAGTWVSEVETWTLCEL
jgi:hypothetical protein